MPEIERDVVAALSALGLRAKAAEPIGRNWREGRVTYRITLTDGRVVKARRGFNEVTRVQTAASLVAALDDPAFPSPLAVIDGVSVEDWIDGRPVSSERLSGARVDAAAKLLGRLHATTTVDGRRVRRTASTSAEASRFDTRVRGLTDRGVLTGRDARRVLGYVNRRLPDRAVRGLIHGDLCADNLVVCADGTLVSVDNEGVRNGFLDFDVARTWCRWRMPAWAWPRFVSRYEQYGRLLPPPDVELAWRVITAVKSAHVWRNAPTGVSDREADVLRAVVRAVD